MGISFSCPFANYSYVEDGLDSVVLKSINFGNDEDRTPVRSMSFKNQDSDPITLKTQGSERMTVEALISLKGRDLEKTVANKTQSSDDENEMPTTRIGQKSQEIDDQCLRSECQVEKIQSALLDPNNPKHEAALKLQKVYKSFRTRRKLADCAILVEQSWWKLLDFAELKHSSISFFDIEKHETAISRWSRARTKAAKVGKGLLKDGKAQKLALQHWLEAIDPRHRYGHNLHFYYGKWLQCQSREPFFYWLDIGEGKEINLEKCPRSRLQQQCIKYLGPMERSAYEVIVEDGRFYYKQSGELLHTTGDGGHAKWIFVLSTSKILYVGKKKKGTFQHSSFLAGGATSAAGRLVVKYGVLKAVWPHSGHYRPTEANFKEFIAFLQENNVNLLDVKMTPVDEDDGFSSQRSIGHLRSHSSDEDLAENMSGMEIEDTSVEESIEETTNITDTKTASTVEAPTRRQLQILGRELSGLEIPKWGQWYERDEGDVFQKESLISAEGRAQASVFEHDQKVSNSNSDDENDDDIEGSIPQESILKRINSHKETKSYQLGKQLSCKWTTGAGPRIGCVRDYPSELQFRALDQVSLSPRSGCHSKSSFSTRISNGLSSRVSTPAGLGTDAEAKLGTRELEKSISSISQRGNQVSRVEFLPLIRGTSVIPIIHTM